MAQTPATESERNHEIECLRAVAVLMTCFSHLTWLLPFHVLTLNRIYGIYDAWSGVDLFFCISGYVVSRSLFPQFEEIARNAALDPLQRRARGWIVAQAFWIRRIYRLMPSAWLWLAVGIACSAGFNTTNVFHSLQANLHSALAAITMMANLASLHDNLLRPNQIYWSLSLEEQFYFMLPLFLLVTPGPWRWRVLLLLIAAQFFVERHIHAASFGAAAFVFRIDALLWGILIHLFSQTPHYRRWQPLFLGNMRGVAVAFNLLLFGLLGTLAAQADTLPIATGLIAIVAAVLVLLASYEANYVGGVAWLKPALVWIGERSYAIYLIHAPVYRFCIEAGTRLAAASGRMLDETGTAPLLLAALGLTLLLAEANHRWIETPLRRRGAARAARRLARVEPAANPIAA